MFFTLILCYNPDKRRTAFPFTQVFRPPKNKSEGLRKAPRGVLDNFSFCNYCIGIIGSSILPGHFSSVINVS